MGETLDSIRMMALLKKAVEHIEAFEDNESENVLKSLGFTNDDLTAIRQGVVKAALEPNALDEKIRSAASRAVKTELSPQAKPKTAEPKL